LIPLDMLWLDHDGVVLEKVSASPCGITWSLANNCPGYGWTKLAKYVLEVNAGKSDAIWLSVGKQLKK
jgi:uncharacterized membrane protein (UPF0127 family)